MTEFVHHDNSALLNNLLNKPNSDLQTDNAIMALLEPQNRETVKNREEPNNAICQP